MIFHKNNEKKASIIFPFRTSEYLKPHSGFVRIYERPLAPISPNSYTFCASIPQYSFQTNFKVYEFFLFSGKVLISFPSFLPKNTRRWVYCNCLLRRESNQGWYSSYTLFFYKHHRYKHRQPEIWPKNKHHPCTSPNPSSISTYNFSTQWFIFFQVTSSITGNEWF